MTHGSASDATSRSRLEARALRWYRAGRRIVDGVDLQVAGGEIVGLLGPNGAGKTVTLSMIVGLLSPTSGHVYIDDEDVTALPLHERARLGLGFLPQERSVFRHLSAEDNIAAMLESRDGDRHTAHARAREILQDFGLLGVADSSAQRLSGGEQRRLEVARSLATEPRFLLADEPFAGIDPLTIESVHAMLVTARSRGLGILLTDHNVRETLALCDRAYVLFEGRVLAMGGADSLMANPAVREHFLGETFAMEPR